MPHDAPISVFIAEDDPDDQLVLNDALAHTGHSVIPRFFNQAEGLMHYLLQPGTPLPQLILVDLNMPGMGGLALISEIRRRFALAQIPIIVLSTSDAPTDLEASYHRGANAYLVKPDEFEQWRQLMDHALGFWRQVALRPEAGRSR